MRYPLSDKREYFCLTGSIFADFFCTFIVWVVNSAENVLYYNKEIGAKRYFSLYEFSQSASSKAGYAAASEEEKMGQPANWCISDMTQ